MIVTDWANYNSVLINKLGTYLSISQDCYTLALIFGFLKFPLPFFTFFLQADHPSFLYYNLEA